MIQILLRLVVEGLRPRGIRFKGFGVLIESSIAQLISVQVVQVLQASSSQGKLISGETISMVVREQDPFSKLCIILVGN
jgi:hypothetical protein